MVVARLVSICNTIFSLRHIQKLLHDYPKLGAIIPEAAMIILVGMVAGLFVFLFGPSDEGEYNNDDANKAEYYYDQYGQAVVVENANAEDTDSLADSILSFSPTIFFVVLLPPVIFNSGYHIQRDLFFRHLSPICLYAFGGTAICTLVVVRSHLFSFNTMLSLSKNALNF
jgi:hypothetical protein